METAAAPEAGGTGARLSTELQALGNLFSREEVSLRDMVSQLGTDATGWLVLLLALPFCAPLTVPGLSTPFGLAIAVVTAREALGKPLWLPAWLLRLRLPPQFFKIVIRGTERFVAWVERRVHPRWPWLAGSGARRRLHSWSLCASALLLALPLGGIPFTNTLPGLAIFVGMIGLMARDGLAILASHLLLAGTLIYFGSFAAVFIQMMHHLIAWWRG